MEVHNYFFVIPIQFLQSGRRKVVVIIWQHPKCYILNVKTQIQLKFKHSPSTQCGFPHQNNELTHYQTQLRSYNWALTQFLPLSFGRNSFFPKRKTHHEPSSLIHYGPAFLWWDLQKKNLFPSQVSFTTFLRTLSQERHLFILHLDLHRLPRILLAPPSPCETLPKFPKQGYLHHSIILNTAVEQEMKLWNKWSCRTPALFTSGKKKAIRTHWSYKKLFLKQR